MCECARLEAPNRYLVLQASETVSMLGCVRSRLKKSHSLGTSNVCHRYIQSSMVVIRWEDWHAHKLQCCWCGTTVWNNVPEKQCYQIAASSWWSTRTYTKCTPLQLQPRNDQDEEASDNPRTSIQKQAFMQVSWALTLILHQMSEGHHFSQPRGLENMQQQTLYIS